MKALQSIRRYAIPALLVLIAAACLLWKPLTRPRYEPTGDELYDAFARGLLKLGEEQGYHFGSEFLMLILTKSSFEEEVLQLDDSLFEERIVEKYGDVVRFQQLLSTCNIRATENSAPESVKDTSAVDTIAAGQYDDRTAAFLILSSMARHESLERALEIAELSIEANPENCYWYYEKALLLGAEKRWNESLESIRLGNAAGQNYVPVPYPASTLLDPAYRKNSRGNRIVEGYIFSRLIEGGGAQVPGALRFKKAVNEDLGTAVRASEVDDILAMFGRCGQMEGATLWYRYMSFIVANKIAENSAGVLPEAKNNSRVTELLNMRDELSDELTLEVKSWNPGDYPGAKDTQLTRAIRSGTLSPGGTATTVQSKSVLQQLLSRLGLAPGNDLPTYSSQDWINYSVSWRYELDNMPDTDTLFERYKSRPFSAAENTAAEVGATAQP